MQTTNFFMRKNGCKRTSSMIWFEELLRVAERGLRLLFSGLPETTSSMPFFVIIFFKKIFLVIWRVVISGISKELWTNTLKNKNISNTRSFHFQVTICYYILVLNNVLPCHRDRQTVSMADLHIQQTDKYSNNLKLYIGIYGDTYMQSAGQCICPLESKRTVGVDPK